MTKFAKHEPHSTIVADILNLPHQDHKFDFAISIAVIHHLSTYERRVASIREILNTINEKGEALFFVWALEQKNSRRGWDEGDSQDQLVPWVLREDKKEGKTFHRYYHLFKQGELEELIREAGGEIVRNGYDRDNWWAVASRAS